MKVSKRFIEHIYEMEGKRSKLYDDKTAKTIKKASLAKGFPTIGAGHLVSKTDTQYDGVTLTDEQIEKLLLADVAEAERIVNHVLNSGGKAIKVTQNQFDALVSFAFNVGPGNPGVKDGFIYLKNGNYSTICRKLREEDHVGVANQFAKWTRSGGVHVDGLVKRRAAERALYLEK